MGEHCGRSSNAIARAGGFTLLEMVVAISIFALMGAMAHVSLTQFLASRDTLAATNDELRRLQQAFTLVENDLRFMVPRGVRDGIGEPLPALVVQDSGETGTRNLVEVTTSVPGLGNPDRHRIRRVDWCWSATPWCAGSGRFWTGISTACPASTGCWTA